MPTVECIENWRGQDVLDATGEKAGSLGEVYYDTTIQEAILLSIKHGVLGRQVTLVPAAEAVLSRDYVRVPYSVDQMSVGSGVVDTAVAMVRTRRATVGLMAISNPSAAGEVEPICSLPVLGATTVEDAVFYIAVGAVASVGWVAWPTAALIGTGHALHQRARNVVRAGAVGEARAGLIEAVEDAF